MTGTVQRTLSRQWLTLRLIPRHPRRITARDLQERLVADGYKVTKRTLERDLQALSTLFPLVCDDRERPFGWNWQKDAPMFAVPGITPAEALALKLVEQHLHFGLPRSLADVLDPYFCAAEGVLSGPSQRPNADWLRKGSRRAREPATARPGRRSRGASAGA
jgi:hypothetical protein